MHNTNCRILEMSISNECEDHTESERHYCPLEKPGQTSAVSNEATKMGVEMHSQVPSFL